MKLTKAQLKQLRDHIQMTHVSTMSPMAQTEKAYPKLTSGVKDAIAGVKQYGHDVITGKIASEGFNRMSKINTNTPQGIGQLVGMMPIGGIAGGIKDVGESLISRILKKTGTKDIEDAVDVLKKSASPAKTALENLTHPHTGGVKVTEITSIPKDAAAQYAEWLKSKPNITSGVEDIAKPSLKDIVKPPVENIVKKQGEAIMPRYRMTRSNVDKAVKIMTQEMNMTPREALDYLDTTIHGGANAGIDIAKTHVGAEWLKNKPNISSGVKNIAKRPVEDVVKKQGEAVLPRYGMTRSNVNKAVEMMTQGQNMTQREALDYLDKIHGGANVGSDISKAPEAIKTTTNSPTTQEVEKLGALLKIHRRLFASMPDGPKKEFVGRKIKEMTQRILVIGGKK